MDHTRVTVAHVIAYEVAITWQQASAILMAAPIAASAQGPDHPPRRVRPEGCVLTRGGDLQLIGDDIGADTRALTSLAKHLLTACRDGGALGDAVAAGRLDEFLEELRDQTPWKRRRVQIARVALDTLAAHFDRVERGLETLPLPRKPRVPVAVPMEPAAVPEVVTLAPAVGGSPTAALTRQAPRVSAERPWPEARREASSTRRPWPEVREEDAPSRPRGLKLAFWSR
jgi:hypothetical protein